MTVPSSYPTLAVRTGEGAGSSVGEWVGIGRKSVKGGGGLEYERELCVMWIVNSSILNGFISIWERKYSQTLLKQRDDGRI